jgi:hypothetical protein
VSQPVYERLLTLLEKRVEQGEKQYGTRLMTQNGRDSLLDAWEEAADLLFYMTQLLLEREEARP